MKLLKSNKGFTMLELLMVVIVVGILASLAIPQYQSFVEKARGSEAKSMISAIKSAQELYLLENGVYGPEASIQSYLDTSDSALWSYTFSVTGSTSYVVTATRKDGADSGDTIIFTSSSADPWSGTHPGA